MPKTVIVWFGQKYSMRKGETIKDVVRAVKDGEVVFDVPNYIKITNLQERTLRKKERYF